LIVSVNILLASFRDLTQIQVLVHTIHFSIAVSVVFLTSGHNPAFSFKIAVASSTHGGNVSQYTAFHKLSNHFQAQYIAHNHHAVAHIHIHIFVSLFLISISSSSSTGVSSWISHIFLPISKLDIHQFMYD
jgi:hypothetical protein